jgi:alpha-D-xyloside xylohydrolase
MESYIYLKKDSKPIARLYFIEENAVRITVSEGGEFGETICARDLLLTHRRFTDSPRVSTSESSADIHEIAFSSLRLIHDNESDTLHFKNDEGELFLKQSLKPHEGKGPLLNIETKPDEGFYGFGEWFNGYRRQRDTLILYNQESPSFVQHRQTYSAFPCFLSDRGYLIFILNVHRGKVFINKPEGSLKVNFEGGSMDYFVIYGPSWKQILQDYTRLTGRPPLLPMWSFGLWNTSYPVENQVETLKRIEEHRKRDIPLDVIIFDYHWEEGFHNYRWRKSIFPDARHMIQRMKKNGVKAGLIYTPYINRRGIPPYKLLVRLYVKNAPEGVPLLSEDSADEIYQEGLRKGYLASPDLTWWLGRAGAVDFSNPEAVEWWFELQKPLLRDGVYFFKNDGGEYLPENSQSALGIDPEEYHNIYSFYYSRATFEKSQEYHGKDRALIFSRTTWAGTQRFPAIFLGDQTPKFKYIQSTMRCGLNMSLLGFTYWGADVFGLYRKPDSEIHKRYSQWALFNPIARYFSAPQMPERNPWGIDRSCEENFRRHVNLRMQLLPYYYRLAHQAFHTGVPIIRPLYLEFQDHDEVKALWEQAMIGDTLMISPVLKSGAHQQRVFFPRGVWYSWWDDTCYHGPGWQEIEVKTEYIPLFVRGGYPLLLGPVLQYIPPDHRFAKIEMHIFPPFEGATYLYEDDGRTLEYQSGTFSLQSFRCTTDEGAHTVTVVAEPATGTFPGQPERREMKLLLHDISNVDVNIDGDLMDHGGAETHWRYESDKRTLIIYGSINSREKTEWHIFMRDSQHISK